MVDGENKYLETLINEVQRRDGGLILSLGSQPQAVVLSMSRYASLINERQPALEPLQAPERPQTVLVTGGAGYIGSHTVRELLDKGYKVVVLDNLSTGRREYVPENAAFVEGDVRDLARLRQVFEAYPIDAVIHFAAALEVEESVREPEFYFQNNVLGTAYLLQAMAAAGVSKIVFSSSAAVYGEQETVPIKEEAQTYPNNPYGHTKLLGEQLLRYYSEYHAFRCTVLRYFNVCGVREQGDLADTHARSHLVPIILNVAAGEQEKIVVNGNDYDTFDGTCIRDYIHVVDVARAHVQALSMRRESDAFRVYNIGTGRGYSVEEMIRAAAEVTGRMIPMEMGNRRPGDAPATVADASKIKEELGFAPTNSDLETIFRTSWNSLQKTQFKPNIQL